jgi:hypothetical protein
MNRPAQLLVSGGVFGAALAFVGSVISPAVGPERWSYPYSATMYVLTEIFILIAHILTALGILGLTDLVRSSRVGLVGVRVVAAALWLFAACEVAAAAIAGVLVDSVPAQLVGAAFGVTSLVYAVGAVVGGVALVRLRTGQRWARWSLLTSGVFVVAVVDPVIFAGNLTVRYLALPAWGLMFCWMAPLTFTRVRTRATSATTTSSHDPEGVAL